MVNFVVVDDNSLYVSKIEKLVVTYMMNNKIDFHIEVFNDYTADLLKYIKKNKKNTIYIIDLELPNGDGIDAARYIRNEVNDWINPIIILTAHTSLYFEVYKQRLQVLDFIGKCECVNKNLLENIDICLRMFNINRNYKFKYKNIEYTIPFDKINYFQREDRRIKIVTLDGFYYHYESIVSLCKKLPSFFIVSSKGVILNTKNVSFIDWNDEHVQFKDGTNGYLVSKSHKKELIRNEFD